MTMDNYTVGVNNVNTVVFVFQHRDTPDNNADTPFEFTEESKKVCLPSVLRGTLRGRTAVCLFEVSANI